MAVLEKRLIEVQSDRLHQLIDGGVGGPGAYYIIAESPLCPNDDPSNFSMPDHNSHIGYTELIVLILWHLFSETIQSPYVPSRHSPWETS